MILRQTRRVPDNAHVGINAFIIHVALPALILGQIHGMRLTPELLFPVSMPGVMFALTIPVFVLIGRVLRFPDAVTGALIITAGLANTAFVGLPMIETFYGTKDLPTGILIDQLGTYLVLSTAGITVACIYSSGTASWREVAWRVATPVLGLLLIALVYVGALSWGGETSRVTIFEAAMGPQIGGASGDAVRAELVADHADGRRRDGAVVPDPAAVVSRAGMVWPRFALSERLLVELLAQHLADDLTDFLRQHDRVPRLDLALQRGDP